MVRHVTKQQQNKVLTFDKQVCFLGFPCGSAGKESACSAGDLCLIPGLGRSPGEGKGYLLQYSGLENNMDYIVHGVAKSWTWLSDLHFQFFPGRGRFWAEGCGVVWVLACGLWPSSSPHAGLLGAQRSSVWPQQRNIIVRNDAIRALWAWPPSGWFSPLGFWYPFFLGTLSFRRVLFYFF